MDNILSSDEDLLNLGYAGTTVVAIKLDSLGKSGGRRKRQTSKSTSAETARNETKPKECNVR